LAGESARQAEANPDSQKTPLPGDETPPHVSDKFSGGHANADKTRSLARSLVAGEEKDGAKPAVAPSRKVEEDAGTRRGLRGFAVTLAVVAVFVLVASLLIAFIRGRRK
jgi:hypothetical protein